MGMFSNPGIEPENFSLVSAGTAHSNKSRKVFEFCILRHKQTGKFYGLVRIIWPGARATEWMDFLDSDSEESAIQSLKDFFRDASYVEWQISMREERSAISNGEAK